MCYVHEPIHLIHYLLQAQAFLIQYNLSNLVVVRILTLIINCFDPCLDVGHTLLLINIFCLLIKCNARSLSLLFWYALTERQVLDAVMMG